MNFSTPIDYKGLPAHLSRSMSKYIDGFVLPAPKGKIEDYRKTAEMAGPVWKEYGALEYMAYGGFRQIVEA